MAHFKLFFKTSGLLFRQRMTLNTLSLLAVVALLLAVAVPVDIDREQDLQ